VSFYTLKSFSGHNAAEISLDGDLAALLSNVLFKCQSRLLGLNASVVGQPGEAFVFFFRRCSDFPLKQSDRL
jgi:hypothetical protein